MDTIIRVKKKTCEFVQIHNQVFENPKLSWRAKGILGYLLTKPDNWLIRVTDIVSHGTEGRDAVQASLQELKEANHAQLVQTNHGRQWTVTEEPFPENRPVAQEPCPEKAIMAKATREESATSNTQYSNTEFKTNTQAESEEAIPESLNAPFFLESWKKWKEFRKTMKRPRDWAKFATEMLDWLSHYPAPIATEMLDQARRNGWQGVFELKKSSFNSKIINRNNGTYNNADAYANV